MKVSLNWIRDYLDLDKSAPEIADILTSLGLEVEGWEAVKPSPVDLDQVVTGLVTACERIPDTDHLSATQVDTGNGVARSIVCAAALIASTRCTASSSGALRSGRACSVSSQAWCSGSYWLQKLIKRITCPKLRR